MGDTLITYGDTLLEVGGVLADDIACCCDGVPCPDCCLRITSGALIDGEIKILVTDGDFALDVTVTTPSGTRQVCDGDEITVAFTFTAPASEDAVSPDAFATWDPIWRLANSDPLTLGAGSSVNNMGHIYWGDLLDREYSVTLILRICLLSTNPSMGLITVGSSEWTSLVADIEIAACPSDNCCNRDVTCEPCCFYLDPESWVWNDSGGKWEYYQENPTFGVLFTLDAMGENGIVCDGGEVVMTAFIVTKDRFLHSTAEFDVIFEVGWPLTVEAGDDPVRAVGYVGTGQWSDSQEREFEVRMGPRCPDYMDPASISITVAETTTLDVSSGSADFLKCDTPVGCLCCCPDYCCGDCHFPVSATACEEPQLTNGYEDGGPTQITGMTFHYAFSPAVMCRDTEEDDYDTPVEEITDTQSGVSRHFTTCENVCTEGSPKLCGHSRCFFSVNVPFTSCDCLSCPKADQFYTVTYNGAGTWSIVPAGGVGGYSIDGGCEGEISGVFVTGGTTLTITFTVQRTMPTDPPTCPLPE